MLLIFTISKLLLSAVARYNYLKGALSPFLVLPEKKEKVYLYINENLKILVQFCLKLFY